MENTVKYGWLSGVTVKLKKKKKTIVIIVYKKELRDYFIKLARCNRCLSRSALAEISSQSITDYSKEGLKWSKKPADQSEPVSICILRSRLP